MLFAILLALAPAQADEPSPFACCDDALVERLVLAWLDASEALAAGKPHAESMKSLAKAAKGKLNSSDEAAAKVIATQASKLAGLPTSAAQEQLQPLAQEVLWLALRHESGSKQVVQATCPGLGSWVQRDSKRVVNPFGAKCGTLR